MAHSLFLNISKRIITYSLPKRCVGVLNLPFRNCVINNCLRSPAPTSFSFRNNSFSQYSSQSKPDETEKFPAQKIESVIQDQPDVKVNQRTRLKQAVRDYGATIIVFHVAISLTSLGLCYLAISNGVDAVRLLTFLGVSESIIASKVAVGGSTFVISYAVHKVFAPIRIAITLSVAPFIVRYLRRIKLLKPPKSKRIEKMYIRAYDGYSDKFCIEVPSQCCKNYLEHSSIFKIKRPKHS